MPPSIESAHPAPASTTQSIFPFFDLPTELRLRILELLLIPPAGRILDLDPTNYRAVLPRLSCFLVCHRMHQEAYRVFYGSSAQPIRLFPVHGRFHNTKKPLLARLAPQYRAVVNTVELRLGPGWGAPPKCWNTDPGLGLGDCVSLRTLKIFVELDPSDDYFEGFRGKGNDKESYKNFCVGLLQGIIEQVPSLATVEVDAYPSVTKSAPLVLGLVAEVSKAGKKLAWGPVREWDDAKDNGGLMALEKAMANMGI